MTTTWIPDGTGIQHCGEVGGDTQVTKESYSVRFWREEDGTEGRLVDDERIFSMVTLWFYGETRMEDEYDEDGLAKDSEGKPIIWLTTMTMVEVCTNRDGGTEVWSEYTYGQSAESYETVEQVEQAAHKKAENYTAEQANRDIGWHGFAPWEREARKAKARQALMDLISKDYEGDPDAALLDIAAEFGFAMAYLDRDWFDEYACDRRGESLTEDEWEKVKPLLKGYSEHVDKTYVPDEFTGSVIHKLGLLLPRPKIS